MLKITNPLWFKNVILSKKKSKTQKRIAPRKKEKVGPYLAADSLQTHWILLVFILEREKERGEGIRRTLGFDFW
jgi:hypothetical protein